MNPVIDWATTNGTTVLVNVTGKSQDTSTVIGAFALGMGLILTAWGIGWCFRMVKGIAVGGHSAGGDM